MGGEVVVRDVEAVPSDATADSGGDEPLFVKVETAEGAIWVLVGRDRNHARELEELAMGFVGPSFADVRRRTSRDDLPNELRTLKWVHTVTVAPATGMEPACQERLVMLAGLLRNRPERRSVIVRTLSQVISDLRVAIGERDRDGAEDLLAELANRRDITRTNVVFLRLQMLNRIGAHDEVLRHPDLNRITGSPRPRDVTQALLESAEAMHLEGLTFDSSLETWATQGVHIRRLLGPVATTIIPPRSAAEARTLLAAELGSNEPDLERVAAVADYLQGADEAIGQLFEQFVTGGTAELEAKQEPRPEADPALGREPPASPNQPAILPELMGLMNRRRFGDALAVLEQAEPQVELAWAAYNVHRELGTDASQRVFVRLAVPLHEQLEHDRDNVELLHALEEISQGRGAVEDPSGWTEWLERARAGATSQELVAMTERGAAAWTATSETAAAIGRHIAQDYELVLRPAYGRALEHHEDVLDTPGGCDLLMEVIEMVVTAGATSQELSALPGWVEALTVADSRQETATRLLQVVRAMMVERPAPVAVNGVADVISSLASHPLHDVDVLDVAEDAAQWLRTFAEVADDGARLALAQALADLGAPRPEADPFWARPTERNVLSRLRGSQIGIYTLMTSVAHRIKKSLGSWLGDGDVQVNSDKVATAPLLALAENADVMFVVTGAAKHPATNAIKQARGNRSTVLIHRKGFTALYEAVKEWAADQASDST